MSKLYEITTVNSWPVPTTDTPASKEEFYTKFVLVAEDIKSAIDSFQSKIGYPVFMVRAITNSVFVE